MDVNLQALRERMPQSPALQAYKETAVILTGEPGSEAEDGAGWVRALCLELNIPRLAALGVTEDDFSDLAGKAAKASSMPIVIEHSIFLGDGIVYEFVPRFLPNKFFFRSVGYEGSFSIYYESISAFAKANVVYKIVCEKRPLGKDRDTADKLPCIVQDSMAMLSFLLP